MKNEEKIALFLTVEGSMIISGIRMMLEACGFEVIQSGKGLETKFNIKQDKFTATMFLRNAFLEIATIDRDEKSLRFDQRLVNPDYTAWKIAEVVNSKLTALMATLKSPKDGGKALEQLKKMAEQGVYERVRIWEIDRKAAENKSKNKTK